MTECTFRIYILLHIKKIISFTFRKTVESLQYILNAVMGCVRLIMQYLSACSITICLLGFGTHSADRQTHSGVRN